MDGQLVKRAFGDLWTARIVELGLYYRPREVICHIKDVTTILCHLPTVPEYIHMLISLFGHILNLVIKVQNFAYYFHLSNSI